MAALSAGLPSCRRSAGRAVPAKMAWSVSRRAFCQQSTHERRLARGITVHSADKEGGSKATAELPIFPLGMVALPAADLPLQIFEARYRVLFSTLLAGEEGVEDDLVQQDSPFKGSKRFGMCFVSREGLHTHGTVLEIVKHQVMDDGRMLILTKGRERFVLRETLQERPVMLGKVEYVEEDEDEEALGELAGEVKDMFGQLLRLNARYKKMDVDDDVLAPPQLQELPPSQLSFWMMSMFAESMPMQQEMLQTKSAVQRLTRIKETMGETIKYLTAALALEGAFAGPAEGDGADDAKSEGAQSERKSGGPD